MERLSLLVNQRVEQGLWKPIKVANSGPHVSHLLFADDVILFTKASIKQAMVIRQTMEEFSALSGMQVNKTKSRGRLGLESSESKQNL